MKKIVFALLCMGMVGALNGSEKDISNFTIKASLFSHDKNSGENFKLYESKVNRLYESTYNSIENDTFLKNKIETLNQECKQKIVGLHLLLEVNSEMVQSTESLKIYFETRYPQMAWWLTDVINREPISSNRFLIHCSIHLIDKDDRNHTPELEMQGREALKRLDRNLDGVKLNVMFKKLDIILNAIKAGNTALFWYDHSKKIAGIVAGIPFIMLIIYMIKSTQSYNPMVWVK